MSFGSVQTGIRASRGPINLGIIKGTTTIADDSIVISGQSAVLGVANVLYIPMLTGTATGLTQVLSLNADVKILLTGATWGQGGKGDIGNAALRVYAINDNGTLKFGVSYQGGRLFITDTDTTATPASASSPEKMLVNSALTAGTWPCTEIGGFGATFDDTGGAAEDLWAVAGGIGPGYSFDGSWQDFNTTVTGFAAASDPTWTKLKWMSVGSTVTVIGTKNVDGTSNAVTFTLELPHKAKGEDGGIVYKGTNNGAASLTMGSMRTRAGSVVADLYLNAMAGTWSAVNAKGASFSITYQIN